MDGETIFCSLIGLAGIIFLYFRYEWCSGGSSHNYESIVNSTGPNTLRCKNCGKVSS